MEHMYLVTFGREEYFVTMTSEEAAEMRRALATLNRRFHKKSSVRLVERESNYTYYAVLRDHIDHLLQR